MIVRLLLDHGANTGIVIPSSGRSMALCAASTRGHVGVVNLLLRKDPNPAVTINLSTEDRPHALYQAVEAGNAEIARLLIQNGASANASPSALLAASYTRDKILVEELLSHGASPNSIFYFDDFALYRCDPLSIAIESCWVGCVQLLLRNGAQVSDEHVIEAAGCETMDVFQLILEARFFLEDAPASCLEQAFGKASTSYHRDIMSLLLDKGADVNTKLDDHYAALRIASREGRRDIVEMLLERGADVNWVHCEEDSTALQEAAARTERIQGHR
ncbi:hypothetical protein CSOJ01_12033 [Colletotrichum sojae]|uniref:Ankyrin n=1 Tax=Colletotrichum sojae TaxID=2175907 RepID=A0A8H6IW22_9PEZI|nr:hypothetical protein CSOJ01_12033 [Colletotrichum sojae]